MVEIITAINLISALISLATSIITLKVNRK